MKSEFNFAIDIPVRNDWTNVDLLRASVQNCFSAMFQDIDGCHALAMVTGELLENAIKYGCWQEGVATGAFRLRVWGERGRAHVSVENPVEPGAPGVNEVLETLKWIEQFPTAADAYRAKLLELATAVSPEFETSKLGLVRIAYEGNCRLRAELTGGAFRITAEMNLASPP